MSASAAPGPVLVMGAGAVGCFVGGRLQAAGLPLRAELLDRDCRVVWAALQAEALAALHAAGIAPAALTPVRPNRLPWLLRLPTWAFERLAQRMLRIDAQARSSVADDLALGRPTEIDAICGTVQRLARAHGRDATRRATRASPSWCGAGPNTRSRWAAAGCAAR